MFLLLYVASVVKPEERYIARTIGMVFLGIGLLLLAAAYAMVVHRRKYGVAHLWLVDPPGVVGGQFAANLHVGAKFNPGDALRVRLECVRVTTSPATSGDSQADEDRESLWLGEELVRLNPGFAAENLKLPIRFEIPAELPPTTDGSPRVEWLVHVSASQPGLDFRERFEVPVIADRNRPTDRIEGPSRTPTESTARGAELGHRTSATRTSGYRIEAERRAGPLWPGTPGVGMIDPGLRHWFTGPTATLRRLSQGISFFVFVLIACTIFGTGARPNSAGVLQATLSALSRVEPIVRWSAIGLGSAFVIAFALRALHRTRHLDRFGISFLRLAGASTTRGARLCGVVEIPRRVVPVDGFRVRLLCVRMRGFRRQSVGHFAETAWASDWHSSEGREAGLDATHVAFDIEIPSDLPRTGEGDGAWQWYVEAHAPIPGLNYIARFLVPVRDGQPSPFKLKAGF